MPVDGPTAALRRAALCPLPPQAHQELGSLQDAVRDYEKAGELQVGPGAPPAPAAGGRRSLRAAPGSAHRCCRAPAGPSPRVPAALPRRTDARPPLPSSQQQEDYPGLREMLREAQLALKKAQRVDYYGVSEARRRAPARPGCLALLAAQRVDYCGVRWGRG